MGVTVKDESLAITVVASEDGVHRVEIYQNALGEYSMHQTRQVLDGRLQVQSIGWDKMHTLGDMVDIATVAVRDQIDMDAKKPNRRLVSVAGLNKTALDG